MALLVFVWIVRDAVENQLISNLIKIGGEGLV
jgi:hypothetical protein